MLIDMMLRGYPKNAQNYPSINVKRTLEALAGQRPKEGKQKDAQSVKQRSKAKKDEPADTVVPLILHRDLLLGCSDFSVKAGAQRQIHMVCFGVQLDADRGSKLETMT